MEKEKIIPIAIAGTLSMITLAGCTANGNKNLSDTAGISAATDVSDKSSNTEMFTDRDFNTEYDENSTKITLNGDSAQANGEGVTVNGSTITVNSEGTYILSGTLNDGQIIIDTEDAAKVHIVFNGVKINSGSSAGLYVKNCDKVFLTLVSGTENTVSNGGTFTATDEENIDGAIFSKDDLTINGTGSLTVTSPAGHGIVCKDDLVFTGGNITITSSGHGIDANDSVRSINATLNITSGKDGIHSENTDDTSLGFIYIENGTFEIASEGDGISSSSYVQAEDGTFKITAGGGSENGTKLSSDSWGKFNGRSNEGANRGRGAETPTPVNNQTSQTGDSKEDDSSESIKGIKAEDSILINGGTYTIDSADDSLHSNNSIKITGGEFNVESGDDGIHADSELDIAGGNLYINESYEGLEAQNITVENGNIDIKASDDGINAAGGNDSSAYTGGRDKMTGEYTASDSGSVLISGGTIVINASGDGIDSNGSLEITGGNTTVTGPTQGDASVLDYDTVGTITGGTFTGTGSSSMAQTLVGSGQGVITLTANGSAGSQVEVKDGSGKSVAVFTPDLSYQYVVVSNGEIVSGQTYTVSVGGNYSTITAK